MRYLAICVLCLGLAACGRLPDLADPKLSERELDLERFFAGQTVARGQFQDRFGTVRQRFDVAIEGVWDGEMLTLTEDFVYDDGSTEQRIWRLRKTGAQTWEGTADGVQGLATGEERGDTFNWRYTIDLPVSEGGTVRLRFDDWMWLLSEDRLLNRAYAYRAGIYIGDVVILFERP